MILHTAPIFLRQINVYNMILKKEELLKMGAFEARVKECQKNVYPEMNALVRDGGADDSDAGGDGEAAA